MPLVGAVDIAIGVLAIARPAWAVFAWAAPAGENRILMSHAGRIFRILDGAAVGGLEEGDCAVLRPDGTDYEVLGRTGRGSGRACDVEQRYGAPVAPRRCGVQERPRPGCAQCRGRAAPAPPAGRPQTSRASSSSSRA